MRGSTAQVLGKRTLAVLIGLALSSIAFAVPFGVPLWEFLTRYSIVESLREPIAVVSVSPDGVTLVDGRFQGFGVGRPVPTDLAAIPALTARGIEIGSDGRAIGLVDVDHWCGNDPIRRHVARVDIGRVLEFLGGRSAPGADEPLEFKAKNAGFTRRGWNVGAWYAFESWMGRDPGRIY